MTSTTDSSSVAAKVPPLSARLRLLVPEIFDACPALFFFVEDSDSLV
jgi:hypothetical protein